jgi:hypothetical protein
MIPSKFKGTWYVQHSRDVTKVVDVETISHLKHRTLMIERYKYPELVVIFNERLHYQLARRLDEQSCVVLTVNKETYRGTQSKSRRIVRRPRAVPTDEEPA